MANNFFKTDELLGFEAYDKNKATSGFFQYQLILPKLSEEDAEDQMHDENVDFLNLTSIKAMKFSAGNFGY